MENQSENKSENKSFRVSKGGTFKPSKEELKNQLDNYSSLPINKSYRGISTLLILFAVAVTTILYFIKMVDVNTWIAALVIYLPLAFFVYKGKKWAIILAMIMWTLDKGFSIYETFNPLIIIWWVVFISYFYKAYLVEKEREKFISL